MKRKGNLYEQQFFIEALKNDLEVFIPLGDYLPQDCIVMNQAGRPFKVQIKGTGGLMKENRGGLGRYMVTAATGSAEKDPIDCTKVDVVAGVCGTSQLLVLNPKPSINRHSFNSMPAQPQQSGQI